MGVSLPASSPFGRCPSLPGLGKVGKGFRLSAGPLRHGANRHFHNEVLTASSMLVLAGAVSSGSALKRCPISKVESRLCFSRFEWPPKRRCPLPRRPPVGSASRHILLAPETNTAIAAFSGHNRDCHFINEFHLFLNSKHNSPLTVGWKGSTFSRLEEF